MLNFIGNLFKSQKNAEYKYLSESVDLVDLERRMKEIDKGYAPYQKQLNYYPF